MEYKNVLIVDDHPIIQVGLKSLLIRKKVFENIDISKTGKGAIKRIKEANNKIEKNYDMLIIDINLPDYTIISLLEKIKSINSSFCILILSAVSPKAYINKLIRLGIDGYVCKTAPDEEIINAIDMLKKGRKFFSSEALDAIVEQKISDSTKVYDFEKLSHREFEIMLLLAKGKPVGKISEMLNLHKSSVATYKKRIFQKLAIENVIELFQIAQANQLIK